MAECKWRSWWSRVRGLREWALVLALSAAFSVGIRTAVVEAYWIPSGSMWPTLEVGDRLLGAKFAYWLDAPHRGDIVVFAPPSSAATDARRLVKRVVAVAGDRVEVRGGRLFVNGAPVREPYLAEPPAYTLAPLAVPAGYVFVLGDNRNNSFDGHVWGLLPVDHVKAKALFRFWPLGRLGRLDR